MPTAIKKPCGRNTCDIIFDVNCEASEAERCYYPNTQWKETAIDQTITIPPVIRLFVSGRQLTHIHYLEGESHNITLHLHGTANIPYEDLELGVMPYKTGSEANALHVGFKSQHIICDAFDTGSLILDISVPADHVFDSLTLNGKSITGETTITATHKLGIHAIENIKASVQSLSPQIRSEKGDIAVTLSALGDTSTSITAITGNISLEIKNFDKCNACVTSMSTDFIWTEQVSERKPITLNGAICAINGDVTIK